MKIMAGKYPEENNWQNWLAFLRGPEIDFIFLLRLAAYMRDVAKVKATFSWGYRSYEDQEAAYKAYLAGTGNLAAKPGFSWHQYGCAVDVRRLETGKYPGTIDSDYALFMAGKPEVTLPKYGLIHSTRGEPWHIIPIECKGIPGESRSSFLDSDDLINGREEMYCKYGDGWANGADPDAEVFKLQAWLNEIGYSLLVDGKYGDKTKVALADFCSKNGINNDGSAATVVVVAKIAEKLKEKVDGTKRALEGTQLAATQNLQKFNNLTAYLKAAPVQ